MSHEVRLRKQMNILLGVLLFVPPLVILVLPGGYFVRPEQPASPPDSQRLSPGTTLQKLQDLRS